MRWLLADQLGPHFDDGEDILLIEAKAVLAQFWLPWQESLP